MLLLLYLNKYNNNKHIRRRFGISAILAPSVSTYLFTNVPSCPDAEVDISTRVSRRRLAVDLLWRGVTSVAEGNFIVLWLPWPQSRSSVVWWRRRRQSVNWPGTGAISVAMQRNAPLDDELLPHRRWHVCFPTSRLHIRFNYRERGTAACTYPIILLGDNVVLQ